VNAAAFVVLWVLFTAIEVLLVGKFDPEETPVGAVVGALAAFGVLSVLRASGERYRFRAAWLRIVPTVAFNVLRDTLLVFGALLRRLAGGPLPDDAIVELPFEAGGDDPLANARRALVIEAVSSAPNSIALDIDRERGTMTVHYLLSGVSKPSSAEWPV
jgi:multisubunit Na+/H+ antiporter MnhE subunit